MSNQQPEAGVGNHPRRPLSGRDPHEEGRVSSPLELLFDLTFAVAFSVAGEQFAHLVSQGELHSAMIGFGMAMFAIIWAWINFTWFASAFDTDDWLFRLTTMVQMVGVVVLAIGLPAVFSSIEHGHWFDNKVMVFGYVVMRVAMLFNWLRAWWDCPDRRRGINVYLLTLVLAQTGWVVLALHHTRLHPALAISLALMLVEVTGPAVGERISPTPWHAHHVAERYSLLAIIALGEGVIGTVAALSASTDGSGTHWGTESVLMVVSGLGVTFALWWVYFGVPFAELLHARRRRSFGFGYLHMPLFAAIAAVGAGLHVVSNWIDGEAHIPEHTAVTAMLAPVGLFVVMVYILYFYMARQFDLTHIIEFCLGMSFLVAAAICSHHGVGIGWCLVLVMMCPATIALGYELVGHRFVARAVARQVGSAHD